MLTDHVLKELLVAPLLVEPLSVAPEQPMTLRVDSPFPSPIVLRESSRCLKRIGKCSQLPKGLQKKGLALRNLD